MGILLRLEVPEAVHALPVLHVRSHDVPVLWMALSHLQSMMGSCSGAYISLLSLLHPDHPVSELQKVVPMYRCCRSVSAHE